MNARRSRTRRLLLLAAVPCVAACATTNSVRWAYDRPSVYPPPDEVSERLAIRAVAGVPLIVGSVAWDTVTWPFQLMFGVWPMWGDESTQMVPPDVEAARNDAAEGD